MVYIVGFAVFAAANQKGQWNSWECVYFAFISISTIGLGDYALDRPGVAAWVFVVLCVEIKLFNHTLNFIDSEWICKRNLSKLRDLDQRGTVVQKSAESTSI